MLTRPVLSHHDDTLQEIRSTCSSRLEEPELVLRDTLQRSSMDADVWKSKSNGGVMFIDAKQSVQPKSRGSPILLHKRHLVKHLEFSFQVITFLQARTDSTSSPSTLNSFLSIQASASV